MYNSSFEFMAITIKYKETDLINCNKHKEEYRSFKIPLTV